MNQLKEKDLEIYDVWEAQTGNLFIKVTENYSVGIGPKGDHQPFEWDLKNSQYIKSDDIVLVKKVGKLIFD
jgi:hypothetical protein